MADSINKDIRNVPSHVLIDMVKKGLDNNYDDRILDELIRRFETTRSLIGEVLNIVSCDCPEQDVISNDVVIQLEESIV